MNFPHRTVANNLLVRLVIAVAMTTAISVAGCASHAVKKPTPSTQITSATSKPNADPRAMMTFDEVERGIKMPATISSPTTMPAPVEALVLYARARDDLAAGRRFVAITELERAVKLDPDRPELHRTLARAYLSSGNATRAKETLEKACSLDPDDLESQIALGRLNLLRGDGMAALTHLSLAVRTPDYSIDDSSATIADYFLARALTQQGYDAAAIERYSKVLNALSHPSISLRGDAEISDWASRPEAIYADVARLLEKDHRYEEALDAWQIVARRDDSDLDAKQHELAMLLALGRRNEAMKAAAETVRETDASPKSLELLRDTAHRAGDEDAIFAQLQSLHQEDPKDRAILFALADLLTDAGRAKEAETLLSREATTSADEEIIRRLFHFYHDRHQNKVAARMLIEATAAHPDRSVEFTRLFLQLLRPMQRGALRAGDVQKLDVSSDAATAKQFFLAISALTGGREPLGMRSLDAATRSQPPFASAFRLAMQRAWVGTEKTDEQKSKVADDLIDRAVAVGGGLADELRGWAYTAKSQKFQAIQAFKDAIAAGDKSSEATIQLAELQLDSGDRGKFEQILQQLIERDPHCEEAYLRMINFHLAGAATGAGNLSAALSLLQRWRAADPGNISMRLEETVLLSSSGQSQEALRSMTDLLLQYPQDQDVLEIAAGIFDRVRQGARFDQLLQENLSRDPLNVAAAAQLVSHFAENDQTADATHTIERIRAAAANDAEVMYLVAQLYNETDQKAPAEATLLEALRLDPDDAGANNDLGYNWADSDMNVARAEAMIRKAVQAEPDNASFLDSLGWVLYKRGEFAEARRYLDEAIRGSTSPDPVVLNHLGDALYRLKLLTDARLTWEKAMQRVSVSPAQRSETLEMRAILTTKLRQMQLGEPAAAAEVPASKKVSTTEP